MILAIRSFFFKKEKYNQICIKIVQILQMRYNI